MKVMQILPALESGGVERGTIDIAKSLKKLGHESIVVSAGGVMVYQLKEAGIAHVEMAVNSKNPLKIIANIKKIRKLINDFAIDIVHVRSRAPMWSAYFACKKTKAKLISTVHGTYSLSFLRSKNFPPKRIYNEIMLKAERIIVVSNFIKDYLKQNYRDVSEEKITVIQRGADLNYFNKAAVSNTRVIDLIKKWNLPEDKKIILMPARFTSWKGHEFLIESLAKVKSDFFCVMIGSDHGHKNYRKKVEELILTKNLAEKIRIIGLCKDMQSAYAMSHLVVCPSIRPEAFGRISIEAQASSKIIIATKIGGALDTIVDGKTGFLVEVGDSEKFATLIDNVLNMTKEETDIFGANARKNIEENFSNEKMCDSTIGLYKSVVGS